MNFLLMHPSVAAHDAIGHDLMEMCRTLAGRHTCAVFCEYRHGVDEVPAVGLEEARDLLRDRSTTVIYHHSTYWPLGEELLSGARARVVFKYHNITPPNYFAAVPEYRDKSLAGREQTYRMARTSRGAFWLSDSLYNLAELGIDQVVRQRVVPPFLKIGGVAPDEAVLRGLVACRHPQALFVSRFVPNKGHLFLVEVLHHYRRRCGEGFTLFVAGKAEAACSEYYDQVMSAVAAAGLERMFVYLGEVPPAVLVAYFLGCDTYLCCSEHEGFCVPIVEAQSLCLPVVARARAAVPETLGAGQVLHGEEPAIYAASVHRLYEDAAFRESVIQAGSENYSRRFTRERIESEFLSALEEATEESL